MPNQADSDKRELFAEDNDFEFQLNLERAFAQLEGDDSNGLLLKKLESLALVAQNQSIPNIAAKIGKNDDETRNYLFETGKKLLQYPPIQQCWEKMKASDVKGISGMVDKDNPDWIDLLAGKSVSDADPNMVRETQIFRAALLSYAAKPKNASEIPYPHILENVFARLDDVLKPPSPKSSWFEKLRAWFKELNINILNFFFTLHKSYKPMLAFAVPVLIVALIIPPLFLSKPPIIPKGKEPCVNDIIRQQPQIVAVNMQKELETFRITATLTPIDNGWRLETTVPAISSPALDDWLERDDLIVLPESHYLCVDILSEEASAASE
jgi:hypothetical protein